jgi:hypothetical protein
VVFGERGEIMVNIKQLAKKDIGEFGIEIMLKVTLITHSHNSMKTTLQIFSDFSRRLQTYGVVNDF